ncbi:hypothetical protein [Acanthopleuribacter pedis]|uniref:Transmembrane protein n=1 Tax=Acanthopleuribacter pedis TaxID=442870 RepID=A0A8J7QJD1_9BACT|nr:hypothetical protein [Acanthopleuribacter pedis]MBO1319283.1 hypothetical protein [Acanthopleuribacter pedis]
MSASGSHPIHPIQTGTPWIRNRAFDLWLVTGGAFFTLAAALLAFQFPVLLPPLFWLWVVAFEGSHFWATFSRTYFDRDFRRSHPKLLWGSTVFFLFPVLALSLDAVLPGANLATFYGFFIFCWSLYHNARQHYGFISIYSRKAGLDAERRAHLVFALYASVCLAQFHFLWNFKAPGIFGLPVPGEVGGLWFFVGHQLPMALSVAAFAFLVFVARQLWNRRGAAAFMPIFYTAVCWLFYSLMFYVIAPRDTFVQRLNGTETLMLIAVMNSLFHNIQYHAIVYHHGQRRYGGDKRQFGAAGWINRDAGHYMVVALLVGAVFGTIVWHLGDWPDVFGRWSGGSMQAWAYVLFFGIIGHHFYLDQKIWRPSQSKALRKALS